jgi:hypothetical protein
MSNTIAAAQRFKTGNPCPICGGGEHMPVRRGVRCYGFLGSDGRYAHCTREEFAGNLEREPDSGSYAHRLSGSCRCGTTHSAAEPEPAAIGRNDAGTPRVYRDFRAKGAVRAYDYRGEDGETLYQVWRFETPGGKTFRQARPVPGGWVLGIEGIRRVPYRLPELLAADPSAWVLIVEGEKDAERLASLGFIVTTNAGGAGKWRPEYSEHLHSRRVCIIADNDLPGGRHAAQVAQSLAAVATETQVLHLPGLLAKGDVSDWLDAGGTNEELERLIDGAPAWEPGTGARMFDHGTAEFAGMLASEVKPERVRFLWPGRLAAGKPSVMDGDPGLGKSTAALDIAARITTGGALPGCVSGGEPRGVVLLSAEDGAADTIVPRLSAAGADLSRVYIMVGVRGADGADDPVTLPGALSAVEQAIIKIDAALLIVDPLMAYLGADTNAHRDQDVRRALAPLAAMLERTDCAGLLIRHLNKAHASAALYRGGGSIGIIGAARFGLLVAKDPEDDVARILAPLKCNIGPEPPALRYRLEGVSGSDAALVVWDDAPVTMNAADLLSAPFDDASRSEHDEARGWLKDYLSGGAKPADEVLREGRKAGFTDITLRRAKKTLSVGSTKSGFGYEGRWAWSLPDQELAANSGADSNDPPKVITGSLSGSSQNYDHLRQLVITLGGPAEVIDPFAGGEEGRL